MEIELNIDQVVNALHKDFTIEVAVRHVVSDYDIHREYFVRLVNKKTGDWVSIPFVMKGE